ncbi:MAG: hypothetical protein AAGB15_05985 [Pseudomonadota bacterium]
MIGRWRIAAFGLAGLVLVLAGLMALSLLRMPGAAMLQEAKTSLAEWANISVTSQGDPGLSVWPQLGVTVPNMTAEAADGSISVIAREAVLGLSFWDLLGFGGTDRTVTLRGARITLTGVAFQDLPLDQLPIASQPVLTELRLEDAEISVAAGTLGMQKVTDLSGSLRQPDRGALDIDLTGRSASSEIALSVAAVPMSESQGKTKVDASVTWGPTTLDYAGWVQPNGSSLPFLKGEALLETAEPKLALEWAGIAGHAVMDEWASARIEAKVNAEAGRLWISAQSVNRFRGRDLTLSAAIEGGSDWQAGGPLDVSLISRAGGLYSAHLNAGFTAPANLSGPLKVSVLNVPSLAGWLGIGPLGADEVSALASLKADLSLTPFGYALSDIDLDMGGRLLEGALAADVRGERPIISAALAADALRLPDPPELMALLRSKTLKDWATSFDGATLDLTLGAASLGTLQTGTTEASLGYAAGTVDLDIQRADLFGGTVKAEARADLDKPEVWEGSLDAAAIDVAAAGLPRALGIVAGTAGGSVRFQTGVSETAPLGLQVSGQLSAFDGVLAVPDLVAIGSGRAASVPVTPFQRIDMTVASDAAGLRLGSIDLRYAGQRLSGEAQYRWQNGVLEASLAQPERPTQRLDIAGPIDGLVVTRDAAAPDVRNRPDRAENGVAVPGTAPALDPIREPGSGPPVPAPRPSLQP